MPQKKMVIELYNLSGLPIKGSISTFTVRAVSESETELPFTTEVEPKGASPTALWANGSNHVSPRERNRCSMILPRPPWSG